MTGIEHSSHIVAEALKVSEIPNWIGDDVNFVVEEATKPNELRGHIVLPTDYFNQGNFALANLPGLSELGMNGLASYCEQRFSELFNVRSRIAQAGLYLNMGDGDVSVSEDGSFRIPVNIANLWNLDLKDVPNRFALGRFVSVNLYRLVHGKQELEDFARNKLGATRFKVKDEAGLNIELPVVEYLVRGADSPKSLSLRRTPGCSYA